MPRTKKAAVATKKSAPTIVSALQELQTMVEAAAPELEKIFSSIHEAIESCRAVAGVPSAAAAEDDEEDEAPVVKSSKAGKKEAPAKSAKATGKSAVKTPDIMNMSVGDLEEFVDENELDVDLDDIKGLKKKRAAVLEAYENSATVDDEDEDEEDEDEEDEDEEDEVDFSSMDATELEEFVDEHDLDIDLDDFKGLKKKRAAVEAAYASSGGSSDDDDDDWD